MKGERYNVECDKWKMQKETVFYKKQSKNKTIMRIFAKRFVRFNLFVYFCIEML